MSDRAQKLLERKLRSLEAKYEKASVGNKGFETPKRLLMARYMFYYTKYNNRLEALKAISNSYFPPKMTRVTSWATDVFGAPVGDKFVVCSDTSK